MSVAPDVATEQEARLVELFRQLTAILIASVLTGILVGGLGARAFMLVTRLLAPERRGFITEAQARVGEVTIAGSFFLIVLVGAIAAMAIGVMLAVSDPWIKWAGPLSGLVVGILLLTTFNALILDPGNFDFALLGDQAVTVGMIAFLFVVGGTAAFWLRNRVLDRLPQYDSLGGEGFGYIPGAALGAVGVSLLLTVISVPSNRADGSLPTIISFVALIGITLIDRGWWIRTGGTSPLGVRVLGYCVLAVLFTLGGVQLVSAIDRIVV